VGVTSTHPSWKWLLGATTRHECGIFRAAVSQTLYQPLLALLLMACNSTPAPPVEEPVEPPPPSLRVRAWSFNGPGGASAIASAMSTQLDALSHCDEHLRRGQALVRGDKRQLISFRVADGRLHDLAIRIPERNVAECLEDDLLRWHFPRNIHGDVELIVFY
jgi:hypothetical protein